MVTLEHTERPYQTVASKAIKDVPDLKKKPIYGESFRGFVKMHTRSTKSNNTQTQVKH